MKKGHLFFGQTVSMKDQLPVPSRRLSDEPACILSYGDLEFWQASVDDEGELRASEIELSQHFQPFCNRLGECGATKKGTECSTRSVFPRTTEVGSTMDYRSQPLRRPRVTGKGRLGLGGATGLVGYDCGRRSVADPRR